MSKHTKGPWQMKVNVSSCVALGPSGALIARLLKTDHTELKQIANARLIAAAPQLLDALRAICDELDGQQGYATLGVYDKARAAIAAATGAQAGEGAGRG